MLITATIFIITVFSSVCANDGFLFLPKSPKNLSVETMQYAQILHAGFENDTFYMRGRFGIDFPIVGYSFDNINANNNNATGRLILLGINAVAHINMRPTNNMRFPVDNFYAILALHLSGIVNQRLSWRFYPIYHVSAHLADGYGADILKDSVRAVSSEAVRGEAFYKPFGDILEFGVGIGWYYHVCAQKELLYRANASMLASLPVIADKLSPFVLLIIENVYQGKNYPGIDISAGILSLREKRAIGLNLRYFNRLQRGYYFERYEKGFGTELIFMY